MAIPYLTGKGLLPEGVCVCSFDEIEARYAVANHRPCRGELWRLFNEYITAITATGIVIAVYVDGSFVTDKTKPSDIDLVLELPPPSPVILAALRNPHFDHDRVRKDYKMDIWPWFPGDQQDWPAFFQEIKPRDLVRLGLQPTSRKGILKVLL